MFTTIIIVIVTALLISLSLANREIIVENYILKSVIQTISDGKFKSNNNSSINNNEQCFDDLEKFAKSLQNMEFWALDGTSKLSVMNCG